MWRYTVRLPQLCLGIFTIIFLIIWIIAWTLNAIKGTRFDLGSLRDMYIWLMTQLNATYAINSIWNSPMGISPYSTNDYVGPMPRADDEHPITKAKTNGSFE